MKKFKILSIDGGGIKGLYSLYALERLETIYKIKIHEHFNMFCGTSTGGIIALGLASGKTTNEMIDFYEKYGEKIFPYKKLKFAIHKWKSYLFSSKYKEDILRSSLKEVFGELTINDLKKFVCIPVIKLVNDTPSVIKKSHPDAKFDRDLKFKITDVAIATSAAPTFFPIASLEELGKVVDGGLYANNPTLIGLIEALQFFIDDKKEFNEIDILSIGNIPEKKEEIKKMNASLWNWRDRIINLAISSQVSGIKYIMDIFSRKKELYKISNYLRIDEERTDTIQNFSLDYSSKKIFEDIKCIANTKINGLSDDEKEKLRRIFNE